MLASVVESSSPSPPLPEPVASHAVVARDARAADAEAIAAIGSTAFPLAYAEVLRPTVISAVVEQMYSPTVVTGSINRFLTISTAQFLVAEQGGVVTGFLHFDCEGREPELHRLYADPGKTGRGIGAALMQELHARLPIGSTYILMVLSANTGAIRFYERCGLQQERRVDAVKHYRDNMGFTSPNPTEVPALIMRYRR